MGQRQSFQKADQDTAVKDTSLTSARASVTTGAADVLALQNYFVSVVVEGDPYVIPIPNAYVTNGWVSTRESHVLLDQSR